MGKTTYTVVYQGVNITQAISGEVITLTYVDKTVGEADELTLSIKNDTLKWMAGWNPQKGDTITVTITNDSGNLPCGTFTVDEIRFTGSKDGGHICNISALGAGVKTAVRTKSSFAHEGKTLLTIVQHYANKYNYTVQGIIHNYTIVRVTQFHETDLEFLHRIAEEYGYMFSLRGSVLVFTYLPQLSATVGAGVSVNWTDMVGSYTVVDKVAGIYVRGQYRYFNPKMKKTYDGLVAAGANPSADVYQSRNHVDDDAQGLYVVDGRMYKKNMDQVEVDVSVVGNIFLVSGNNATLVGGNWGVYAGTYFIGESRHTVDLDGGYVTGVQFKKILVNQPTGNAPAQEVGYPAMASIAAQAQDIINQLQSLINTINGNALTSVFLNGNQYTIQADIAAINNKGRTEVGGSVTTQYTAIFDEATNLINTAVPGILIGQQQTINDAIDLQTYLKDFLN